VASFSAKLRHEDLPSHPGSSFRIDDIILAASSAPPSPCGRDGGLSVKRLEVKKVESRFRIDVIDRRSHSLAPRIR
jgi:hypothetical protein